MSAAVDARGLKRVCAGCGIRFYDLNKRPITCPGCNAEFSSEIKLKARRGRAAVAEAIAEEEAAAAKRPIANDQFEEVEATADTVSLEEIEEGGDDGDEEQIEGGDEDIADIEDLEDDDDLEGEIGKVEKE